MRDVKKYDVFQLADQLVRSTADGLRPTAFSLDAKKMLAKLFGAVSREL